ISYTIPWTMPDGTKSVRVAFAGDATYLPYTRTASVLTVAGVPSYVTIYNVVGSPGQMVTLKAMLWNPLNNAGIVGRTVPFRVKGVQVGTATTGANGLATISYTIPASAAAGPESIQVAFAGDATYLPYTRTASVLIVL